VFPSGHCVACPSLILWLPLWYLMAIVLLVLLWFSDYPYGILWPLCCLSFFDSLITSMVSYGHCVACPSLILWLLLWYLMAIVLLVLLWFSDYPYGILWPLCCLPFFDSLITPMVSYGHCVACPSLILWLPLWYLMAIVLLVLLWFSDYPYGILWPLCCLPFFDSLITPMVSYGHCVACPSLILWLPLWYLMAIVLVVLLWFSDYPYGIF
jgi:hypothetical protein